MFYSTQNIVSIYTIILFISYFMYSTFAWTPQSWKDKTCSQLPKYKNIQKLQQVESILASKPPLVISPEIDNLRKELCEIEQGQRFLFMGGDCAETFREHSTQTIINNYQLFILSSIVLMTQTNKKITKIARAAGQFSKPRSKDFEQINGVNVPSYKGDMINREHIQFREPDPYLMIRAYHQSTETINLIRALSYSHKYSNINIQNWKTELMSNIYQMNYLNDVLNELEKSIHLISCLELEDSVNMNNAQLYTGHEGLLLHYEQALTRQDRFTNNYYDCSSHFVWIGERTRQINQGHVEFFRGIRNPIGIKISHNIKPWELIELITTLNPTNEHGKICVISRMGPHIKSSLPTLIDMVEKEKLNVIWVCDPMHGNGKIVDGIKTRYYDDIIQEVDCFFDIHYQKGTIPGGIHLEMTSKDVTECLGGKYMVNQQQNKKFLEQNYLSSCDPRLNFFQTFELIEHVSNRLI